MDIARQYKLKPGAPGPDPFRVGPDPRGSTTLHLRCGEDILETIAAAGIPGYRSAWTDPLCEGPIRSWSTDRDRRRDRAIHLALRYFLAYGEVLRTIALQDRMVEEAPHYGEVVLWFEHDLYDQAILTYLLTRLEEPIGAGRVSLVSTDRHPSVTRFIGLGQLGPEALAELFEARVPVTGAELEAARSAWGAFQARTPERLGELASRAGGALPFLAPALGRYLAEYPSTDDGLSLTERLGLEAVAGGAATPKDAFVQVQAREAAPFQGDSMFYAVLRGLARGSRPLLAAAESGVPPLGQQRDSTFAAATLRVTPAGEAVLAGRDDWFRLEGSTRWIGGVQLIGPEPGWRYDRRARQVVAA